MENYISGNMTVYDQLRSVPKEATKPISGGKLKGFTNITPQWRYETLTRVFGPCGVGWRFDKPEYCLEKTDDGTVVCFCSTSLYVRIGGVWSEGIPGEGGSKFVAKTYNGMDVSDECRKMALTDAISTAAKLLGLAADVYYAEGRDGKYTEIDSSNGIVRFGPDSAPQVAAPQTDTDIDADPRPVRNLYQSSEAAQVPNKGVPADDRCEMCGEPITHAENEYSMQRYGKRLCGICQPRPERPRAPDAKPMTRLEALGSVIPMGKYNGKTIGEVIATDRKTIEVFARDAQHRYRRDYEQFWRACNAAIQNP